MSDDRLRVGMPLFVFLLLSLAIVGVGYYVFQQQARHLKESAQRELATIADLKAEQVANWRSERKGDAQATSHDYFLESAVSQWFQEGSPPGERRQRILDRLTTLQRAYDYHDVVLLDDQGTLRLSTAAARPAVIGTTLDLAIEAMRTGAILFSDLHRAEEEPGQPIRFDLLAPLLDKNGQALGVLLFRIDPDRFLFPLIQSWPTPSASAETMLVERSGNDALYLNELRHQKHTALAMRFTITEEHLASAIAAGGQEQVFEAVDYRNIPVLAATRKIPDSPWVIVAKEDLKEVYAPIHERILLTAELTVVLVALAGMLTALWLREKSSHMAAREYQSRLERQALIQHFDYLAKYANDIIFLYDSDFRIVEMNDRALAAYGYTREELLGMHISELRIPEAAVKFDRHRQQLEERKALVYETQAMRKDKTVFPVEVSARMIVTEGRTFYQCIIRDITERKLAEEALRKSQIDLNRAQAVAHVGSWRMDIRNNRVEWSDENYRIFGVPQGTPLTYQSFLDVVHRADRELVDKTWREALAGKHYDLEHRIIVDQKTKWVRELAELEFDEHGALLGAFGTTEDITDIKNAQEALQHERAFLRQVIDTAPSLIFVKDREGRFLLGNEAMAKCYGTSPENLIGLTDGNFNPNADEVAHFHQDDLDVISTYQPKQIPEEKVTHADGSVHWYSTVMIPLIDDGNCDRLLGVAADITDRKRAEEALRLADRRKDEFLAMLGHELRNPLAPISNAVEILKLKDLEPAQIAQCTDIINRQVKHLARLVDDLLDVSRISRGLVELKKESLEVRDFILPAVEACQPLIDTRRHTFSLALPPEPVWVEGDRIRLAQVVSNLINNAAKYTEEGGHIGLSVEASGSEVCIHVSDNGSGIDPADLSHLFDLFYQADRNLDRAQGGLGIGLSLVHNLVALHGGNIQAFSAGRGQGSEFVVRLPRLIHSPSTSPITAAPAAPSSNKLRILVVDDNRDVTESLTFLLESDGHQVLTAFDGISALETARIERPDIILLDIGLPGMDGYAVAQAVRQNHELERTMLIALTGYGQPDDRKKSSASGFDEHLVKPIDIEMLRKLLASYQTTSFHESP